ncbi:spore maturation protein [Clostridium formicaceticum]|jgi:spore maturation protein B|uniref:Spore maturation protein n=1 Tax=Clostridium formicaceticum TaxID=1497 RepID=A0AAC9WEH8_9CLOT|nr:nucleoside recognition domain-containing protein [Clostridium formicaceticum]AOY75484.1 spore maturation protein [Clostridium formicaceticum]ARE85771.1 Spore maturation protein B [Clostridium formicaceticum]
MTAILTIISLAAIPIMITIILLHGLIKGVNLYDAFAEGAGDGFKTAIRIMPYLIAIFIAIGLMRKSGAMDFLISFMTMPMTLIGIPAEVLPLAVIRPISGSGALAVLKDIITHYGPDSFVGRVASTMMGSAETIFYTMAVYFGAIGVKYSRHTVLAALLSHFAAIIASVVICRMIF